MEHIVYVEGRGNLMVEYTAEGATGVWCVHVVVWREGERERERESVAAELCLGCGLCSHRR